MNEDDVANFIRDNPEFFRRRPWLLASIDLPDPHDGRAVSLAERDEARLPQRVVDGLKDVFAVPAVAVRIWEFEARFAGLECTRPVGVDVVRFAASMQAPFCGLNADFEAAGWMQSDAAEIRSLALIPLRTECAAAPFGLLTLGSADLHRFRSDMGTAFLSRIGQLAAAALSRLRG